MSSFNRHYNPIKALYPILGFIAVGAAVVLLIFAFSWLANNIYTLIWIFLVLGCLVWLADCIYMSLQDRINNTPERDHQFPSEKYEG